MNVISGLIKINENLKILMRIYVPKMEMGRAK
jgi:hypothetical protein